MSVVGIVKAFRRVFDSARHATGSRSSARNRPGHRWQQCPGCDERVPAVHPLCSFCPQCCSCRPGRPGGGGDEPDDEHDDDRPDEDGGQFRFSVQDT